jgi:CDP-diacylglycerol--glycerol-3-phosphate 3-phosphatidyltransferase
MMSWPNRLTVLRILLLTPFVILLLNSDEIPELRFAAMAVFAAMALCDLLDGHLARRLNQRTRLGAILDPLADKLVLVVSVILLTSSTWPGDHTDYFIPKWVTITLLSKDAVILLGIFVLHFITNRREVVNPSRLGKISTAASFVLVLVALVAHDLSRVPHTATVLYWALQGLGALTAGLSAAACLDYIRLGSKLIAAHSGQEHV